MLSLHFLHILMKQTVVLDLSPGLQEREGGREKCGHECAVTEILVWIDLT